MASSDQLFGIGAFSFSKRAERIRGPCKHTGLGRNRAAAIATGANAKLPLPCGSVTSPFLTAALKNSAS